MASDIGDGDYLGAYRRFFVDFLDKVNPDDQLPIKTSGHDVTEGEIAGEIVHMTLQYLNQELCPPSLQCYIVQLVIEEIKATCRKQPESCGFRQEEKTYAPLKLMQAVTGKVNEICQRYLENSRLALLPPPPSTPMPLATAFAIRNNRRKMEDRHVILHDLNTIFNIKDDSIASYYAVFDGHAGYQAAVFCATHLHQYLAESRLYPTDPERALRDAFLTTDARFIQKSTRQTLSSGTTAVCALILNRKLYVAWAGDSQAAIAKRGIVTQLVNPHKPDRNDERERVEEMGGTVMHLGIWRVNGNLAVSRAIGDAQYKPYVTGDPEIRTITLDGHEDFLIIACDGLWDCVTENEAATLVYRDLYRDPYNYESTSQRLVEYAKNQGSIDNITVIVVFLSTPRQIASRSPYGNPLLADVQLNNMEPDNRYLSNANGQFDVNSQFVKQQTNPNNGSSELTMDDDENYGNYGTKSSNGKHHENGGQVADYDAEEDDDDLGPETDVDAVDDVSESIPTLADVSRQLFTDKPDPSEIYQNDECMDDDSPPSPHTTKKNQQALIPESDNVGDSEDSEDEWNYYRIDPNKEKEETAGAAGFGPLPKVENTENDNIVSSTSIEHEDTIVSEKEREIVKDETDTSSDSESEREIRSSALIDTEISVDPFELRSTEKTEIEAETKKSDELEEKITSDEIGTKESEEDMDFQLNPNAAEFVPVSPTLTMPGRIDLDVPIAGSPLKSTSVMDDIKIPSSREFQNEIRSRPHEIEEKNCTNGELMGDTDETTMEKFTSALQPLNLDESEVSSTKAEFGDESSFLTTSEFHRTGISTLDGSFNDSYGGFDDSSVDPMTKSFGPSDFVTLSNPVDLNAVHDLTDADLMGDEEEDEEEDENSQETENEKKNRRNFEIAEEHEKVQSPIDPLAVNQEDNLLESSPCLSSPQLPVDHIPVHENTDIPPVNLFTTEILQPDEIEEKPIVSSSIDDLEIDQTAVQRQTILEDHETNVTEKLLEMDLEDRGSQDCGFEKCNEKWSAEDEEKENLTKIENEEKENLTKFEDEEKENLTKFEDEEKENLTKFEDEEKENLTKFEDEKQENLTKVEDDPMDFVESPVPHENLVETFNMPESLPVEEAKIDDEKMDFVSSPVPQEKDFAPSPVPQENLVETFNSSENLPVEEAKIDDNKMNFVSSPVPQENDFAPSPVPQENDFAPSPVPQENDFAPSPVPQENLIEDFSRSEHLPVDEENFHTEKIDHLSSPVQQENLIETFSLPVEEVKIDDEVRDHLSSPVQQENIIEVCSLSESHPVETTKIDEFRDVDKIDEFHQVDKIDEFHQVDKIDELSDVNKIDEFRDEEKIDELRGIKKIDEFHDVNKIDEFRDIEKITETLNDLHTNEVESLPQITIAPDVPMLHNPLALNVEAQSIISHDNVILEDDSFCVNKDITKIPDSPGVGVSPLDEHASKNLFDNAEFDFASCATKHDISNTIDESLKTEEIANISSGLKLSESLQEFTGLEQQLNPEKVTNGIDNNLMDIPNDESKEIPMKIDIEEKLVETILPEEPKPIVDELKKDEPTVEIEKSSVLAACVATATVAAAGTAIAAKATKAKISAKSAPKSATTTKTGPTKSTPTSPTKPAGGSRTSALAATKKPPTGTSAARPNKLETVGKTGSVSSPGNKLTSSTATKTTLGGPKPSARLSTASPRVKPSTTATPTKTVSLSDKKPTSNGDVTKSPSATNKIGSTSAKLPSKPLLKSSTVAKSTNSTTTTTTSSSKTRTASATATSTTRLTSRTTTVTGNVGTTAQRPKTAPSGGTTNLVAKSRLAASTKSPITEKQIKETANKQISSSRTSTTTTASKTSRTSGISSTMTTTRRVNAAKSTSTSSAATSNNVIPEKLPPPIRKPASMMARVTAKTTTTTNGKTNSAKTTTTATKTKVVVENGVCMAEQETQVLNSTTTTMSDCNDEDVLKKDLSPIEPITDNQLIITAD